MEEKNVQNVWKKYNIIKNWINFLKNSMKVWIFWVIKMFERQIKW